MPEVNQSLLTATAKVLIIDDVPANLKVLMAALAEEYEVMIASSGPQGLELAKKTHPDLIMLDISMPGMDGLEVCRRLKSDPALKDIPVVFSTALADAANEAKGLLLGAADFINKPLKIEVVKLRIRNIIDSNRLRKLIEQRNVELSESTRLDSLTGLPNRVALDERLSLAITQARRSKMPLALMFVDLDGFKSVNDDFGHAAGDHLLIAVARRMQDCVREGDLVARLGGDEFVVLINNLENESASLSTIERLIDAISTPVPYDEDMLKVTGSIGVCFFPQKTAQDAEGLIAQADEAMYQAKKSGKNRYAFYGQSPLVALDNPLSPEEIQQALAKDAFHLVFCPELDIQSGQIVAAEALLRWEHPELGLLGPATFLTGLEKHPVSVLIGEWVQCKALQMQAAWAEQGIDASVNVNISAYHLSRPSFTSRLQEFMNKFPGAQAQRIKFDIQESDDPDNYTQAQQNIEACVALGFSFALDDFGTGQSSLTFLRHIPIQQVKLDRLLIDDLVNDTGKRMVLGKLISLLKSMDFSVLIEGVETDAVMKLLQRMGCDRIQGRVIAPMLSEDAVCAFIGNWDKIERQTDSSTASEVAS